LRFARSPCGKLKLPCLTQPLIHTKKADLRDKEQQQQQQQAEGDDAALVHPYSASYGRTMISRILRGGRALVRFF
jgi:hypothetical protein